MKEIREALEFYAKKRWQNRTVYEGMDDTGEKAKEALSLLDKMDWQPIETAPKDGTTVFLWTGNDEFPTRWEGSWRSPNESELWVNGSEEPCEKEGTFSEEEGWFNDEYMTFKLQGESYPTHWRPLPDKPNKNNTLQ